MGLFDFLTREGRFKRHVRRMSDRDAPPEDREASAQLLFEDGGPEAIRGLLSRFDMNLTQQLKDGKEKEWTFGLLVQLGDVVVEPLKDWLRGCKQFAWPLRLLEKMVDERAALDMAYELLEAEQGRNMFDATKKKALLIWLADRRDAGAVAAAVPYVDDFDEDVRYAAAEVVIHNPDAETAGRLIQMLTREDEDSNRLKVRLCEVLASRAMAIDEAMVTPHLPYGYEVRSGRIQSVRGA
ncbi:MAG: hypothetical protein ACON5B_14515 [Myxococcota bacterium]